MLELMARGGMRVGEVLNLTPVDIQERTLAIKNPKSGRVGEAVYVPRKILVRLSATSVVSVRRCLDAVDRKIQVIGVLSRRNFRGSRRR